MKIYKYPLQDIAQQFISLPGGSDILSVQVQNDNTVLWARVDPRLSMTALCDIRIYSTGSIEDVSPSARFLGTVQLDGGDYVRHVFIEADDNA